MSRAAVAVLGAGPAGLAAALRVASKGHDVVVLERAPVVGGMAASFEVAGVRVDHGSHRLHPSVHPEVLGVLRRLLGDELQERARNGRIRLGGRWVGFPLRAGDLIRGLPPSFALRAARDSALAPLRRPRADTFAEVVRAGLGPTVADEFYRPYVTKLWGLPPDQLSGELARRRVAMRSTGAVVRRLTRHARPAGRTFLYPRHGFGTICERLADAAFDAGADLRVSASVTGIDVRATGYRVRLADGAELHTDHVWSTLPLPALAHLVEPAPPPEVRAAAGGLTHRALVLVYLVLERRPYTPFDTHYFPALDVALSRLSEPVNFRDGPDPRDRTVLCAEVPCAVGDESWERNAAEHGAEVAAALERQGLPAPAAIEVEVRRLPRVYPVYRPGFETAAATLERWSRGAGVRTFGRQGLFVPDNTHHALAMGWAIGDALGLDGRFDERRWADARERFRDNVVED